MWAGFATTAIVIGCVALIGGYLGWFHGIGDSLAVFRVFNASALFAVSLLALGIGARVAGTVGVVAAIVALTTVVPHWLAHPGRAEAAGPTVAVYQKNLWFRLEDPQAIIADILGSGADIVTLQEVGPRTEPVLEALRDKYPVQIVCPSSRVGGVAVLSRFPERHGSRACHTGKGLVSIGLETPAGPIQAASVHLHWPWPFEQPAQVAHLTELMRDWDGQAVIGGDFNMVRWSHTLRAFGRASGTAAIGPARITLRNKRLLLNTSIDHVLATGGQGHTALRPTAGSDHNGVLARITLPQRQATRP